MEIVDSTNFDGKNYASELTEYISIHEKNVMR